MVIIALNIYIGTKRYNNNNFFLTNFTKPPHSCKRPQTNLDCTCIAVEGLFIFPQIGQTVNFLLNNPSLGQNKQPCAVDTISIYCKGHFYTKQEEDVLEQ